MIQVKKTTAFLVGFKAKNLKQMTREQKYCKDCNTAISYKATRCNSCARLKKNSPYIKEYIKMPACIDCGKTTSRPDATRCQSCFAKYQVGKNHPCYVHGEKCKPYTRFTEKTKEQIRARDAYKCVECGLTNEEHLLIYDMSLHVHHIDYNKDNPEENNLIALCMQCHLKTNFNRSYWTAYFAQKRLVEKI